MSALLAGIWHVQYWIYDTFLSLESITWLSTGLYWKWNFSQTTFTGHGHAVSSFPKDYDPLAVLSCIDQASRFGFKTKGRWEPRTVCPRVGIADSQKLFLSFSLLYLHMKLLSVRANVRQQWTKNISASVRTLTSSLFSATKLIEKRHCFFKIALAVISWVCPLLE